MNRNIVSFNKNVILAAQVGCVFKKTKTYQLTSQVTNPSDSELKGLEFVGLKWIEIK